MEKRPITQLARVLRTLYIVAIILTIVDGTLFIVTEYSAAFGIRESSTLFQSMDTVYAIMAPIFFLFWILVTVLFFIWLFRVTKNLRAAHKETHLGSPAWAVVSYFVPIINFFQPYVHMRDIFIALKKKGDDPLFIKLWWSFILLSFASVFIIFLYTFEENVDAEFAAFLYGILSAIDAMTIFFALQVVGGITSMYTAKFPDESSDT